MVINLATIDFCPSGGGQKPEEVLTETITTNGSYSYSPSEGSVFSSVDVTVAVPDKEYVYEDGVVTGLSDLGWDVDDIKYFQDNVPHNSWEDSEYIVSQANKDLYGVVNDSNLSTYMGESAMVYLPKFSTAERTNWLGMFYGFSQIKGIPKLDYDAVMENGLYLENTFAGCSSLETISPIPSDLKVTGCVSVFSGCTNLKKVPLFDTSECNLFDGMFSGCSSLETIPLFDMTNATSCGSMFEGCTNLKNVPPLQITGDVYNTGSMFKNCSNLVSIPALNTSGSDNFDDMFYGCYNLSEINGIDFSGVTEAISGCIWDNSAGNYIIKFIVNGKLNFYSWDFSGLINIDYQSVKSILQAADNTDNVVDSKNLTFNITMTDQDNELAGLVSSAGSKGWTITGLTLV